jgi:hypothetical protein
VWVDSGEFGLDLRRRVREAKQALREAAAEGDLYAVDVRTGELDSLLRLAMENGVDLGVEITDRAGDR